METNDLQMWERLAARHEEEWKRIWESDSMIGPLVYSRDVVPYKHLARLARAKANQPVCWAAADCLDKSHCQMCGWKARHVQAAFQAVLPLRGIASRAVYSLVYKSTDNRVATRKKHWPDARVGIELSNALQGNKLLILVSDKTRKNAGNGELRYTAGT
jgi:hypothetical protein